ncbi:MAG: 5-methyltetrahydropteroyltriglutamate--homocysteine S-methyltransferase [Treponema sp.]|nr:5-methyltetrahydropteroyltriglutamate--homocysteine S-methyltransferase [Treponema sp.]
MEQTSVIGFPRVGAHRELKFAIEKYFAGKVSADEVQKTAAAMREYGWKKQKDAGISFIASNDFSFYDNMLDTAFMLNAIPSRYAKLGLSSLDTYFAMAHGYQGDKGDVKALPMKKWFNTNYHYLVPELEDGVRLAVSDSNKALDEYREAKKQGVDTVPYLIGPYTFLHFANYAGSRKAADYAADIKAAYVKEIGLLAKEGASWVTIAEPALVFDVSKDEAAFFTSLYKDILAEVKKASSVKVSLLTYFGDIRDSYDAVTALPFDGIGLDFVEGKESLKLVRKGFPKDKVLFAGIVNGKNIWRANYEQKATLYAEIKKAAPGAVIGTSCSLQHVPYTTANESKLPAEELKHFSFAEQKLCELADLAKVVSGDNAPLAENKKLFDGKRTSRNEAVWQKISALKDADFVRKPAFAEREKIQKDVFKLPLFPTTTIGSFPQTKEVRANRSAFKKGEISEQQYIDFNKKQIADCIKMQEELDIDVLVHGEFERNDMVEYFGDHLDGYRFTENAWVQSYGTRCVKPPVIWGDVSRREAITVFWSSYAQSCTKRPMKGMLTGPVTILNWSFPREDISLKDQTLQIAFAIKDEVLDLEKNGIRIIQIDEAALREKLPLRKSDWHTEYLDWAVPAFRLVHSTVKPETQIHTHMCYSEFGDIIKDIDDLDADVISFEASRADLTILDDLKAANFRTEVGPGVYDIHSPRIPSKEEIVEALGKMLKKVPAEKLWVNPDCGLKTRGNAETLPSLKNMVAAAKEIRQSYKK